MKIAVDAMGGDNAPDEIVKGAILALQNEGKYQPHIVLVGDETAIRKAIPDKKRLKDLSNRLTIRHTSEVIEMSDPASSFRTKKNASMVVCAEMVGKLQVDAMISAGNTAAAMGVAIFKLGRIPEVDRPALGVVLPGGSLLLDVGATTDCDAQNLVQFALMGSTYVEASVVRCSSPLL